MWQKVSDIGVRAASSLAVSNPCTLFCSALQHLKWRIHALDACVDLLTIKTPRKKKPPIGEPIGGFRIKPGSDLLSHGETPHYHRRCTVSLLSSGWDQVGPQCYGFQTNLEIRKAVLLAKSQSEF